MKAQGLLTLVYVAAVLAYAAADRDVSPFIPTLLIDDEAVIVWRASPWLI